MLCLVLPLLSYALVFQEHQGPGKGVGKKKNKAVLTTDKKQGGNVGGTHVQVHLKAGTGKCAPEKGELQIKSGYKMQKKDDLPILKGMDDLPSFYLHQEFVDGKQALLDCFYKAKNSTPGVDEFDFKLMPDTAEHMVDIWMLEQLAKHPKRVMQPDAAKLHVVDFPIFNSYAGGRFWKCGSHEGRIAQLVNRMTASKWYRKSQGKDFLIIATAPDAVRVFTEPLIQLAKGGHVLVATADKNYPSVEPFKRKVVIPYKSMHPVEANAWNGTIPMAGDRKQTFMFHGDIQKGKRSVLSMIKKGLSESDIQDHDFQGMGMNKFKTIVQASTAAYLNTKFCLVVEGSTPTSRRLFDSLAAGCVPILIGGEEGIKRNLAFQKTIDWSKLVFYGGDLDCVGANYAGSTKFLNEFLQRPEAEMDEVRRRGVQVFKDALSYKGPGIVNALLREVEL